MRIHDIVSKYKKQCGGQLDTSERSSMLHWCSTLVRLGKFVSMQVRKREKNQYSARDDDDRLVDSPQLHAKLFLDIIIVPVILPQLVSLGLCGARSDPSEVRKICLAVVPI